MVPAVDFIADSASFFQGFPRDFSRCENPAGFHGIRDNPVIPWNFENPVPVQPDPVEMFTIPIPSGVFFLNPDPVQTSPVKFRQIP